MKNQKEAQRHPAWYELEDGEYVANKMYFVEFLEEHARNMRVAMTEGQEDIEAYERHKKLFDFILEKFKEAPGIMPYIVGVNSNESYSKQFDVPRPDIKFFDSKWNHPQVKEQGKFN